MTASQIRKQARQNLANKWGKAVIQVLIYFVISLIITKILSYFPSIGRIVSLFISVPLSYGLLISIFKIIDDKNISYIDFITDGFANFGKVWNVTLQILLQLLLPILLLVIAFTLSIVGIFQFNKTLYNLGTILSMIFTIFLIFKKFSYNLSFYILYDNPEISGKEAVQKSAELMSGNIGKLFYLKLSFIGWVFLSIFTFGLGSLWLIPYIIASDINFYRYLKGEISSEN